MEFMIAPGAWRLFGEDDAVAPQPTTARRCSDGARTFRTGPDCRDRFGIPAHRRRAAARGDYGSEG